jgi:hypothetical protein
VAVPLLLRSANRWADAVVDFGQELYVAWRLSEGEVLYRDLARPAGPLSPYANALWFALFGPSLRTLVAANLAILAAIAAVWIGLVRRTAGDLPALAAGAVFFAVFAFGHVVGIGNYNYVCPYAHEYTHGLLLSGVALLGLGRWAERRDPLPAALAGLSAGGVALTRPEVSAALAAAAAAMLVLGMLGDPVGRLRGGLAFLGAAAVPPLVATMLLSREMPLAEAFRGVVGSWPAVFAGEVASLGFFREGLGLDAPATRIAEMLLWLAGLGAFLGSFAAIGFLPWRPGLPRRGPTVFLLSGLLAAGSGADWLEVLRPLPLLLVGLLGMEFRSWFRERSAQQLRRIGLAVFSLVLLGKIVLRVHAYHYGFALAMPGTLLAVAWLVGPWPVLVARRGGDPVAPRAAAAALLWVVAVVHVWQSDAWLRRKTLPVGTGADRFYADERGSAIQQLLGEISRRVGPNETLLVVPEGAGVNYLARRRNPTRFTNFMPTEIVIYGEDQILCALERGRPPWVAWIEKDTSEFGLGGFGEGYGRRIASWVVGGYREVWRTHGPSGALEIVLLRRVEGTRTVFPCPAAPREVGAAAKGDCGSGPGTDP